MFFFPQHCKKKTQPNCPTFQLKKICHFLLQQQQQQRDCPVTRMTRKGLDASELGLLVPAHLLLDSLKRKPPVASRALRQSTGCKMTHALLPMFQRLLRLVRECSPRGMRVRMLPFLREASSIFMRLGTGYNN